MKRTIAAGTALAAGLLVTSMGLSAPAGASTSNDLTVNVTGHGGTANLSTHHVHQGYLRLLVNDDTAEHQGTTFTVVDVHRGHTINQLLAAIDLQAGQDASPADAAKSTRTINRIASAFGGADTQNAAQFVSSTVFLPTAGRYYLVAVTDKAHNLGRIDADHDGNGNKPARTSNLLMGNGATDTFALDGATSIPSSGTLRVQNNGDGIHLQEMWKVKDGTTDAQVQAEFDLILAGKQPTSDPAGLNSPPVDLIGVDAVTPHNAAYLTYANLPKGDYLTVCFIADDVTGVPHVFMNMHLIIHVV